MKKNNLTWLDIDSHAFEHNVKQLKKIIGDSVSLSIVIKGNAYGHGLKQIAQLCEQSPYVDWLCAISLSEALTLRKLKVTKPILVLSFIDADPALAIARNIDLIVQDMSTAHFIHERAQKIKKAARIHLKIDTGLSRLGFFPDDTVAIVQQLMQLPYLTIAGIGTHFANTSNPASEFTIQQQSRFEQVIQQLEKLAIDIPIKHAANSASNLNHPQTRYNFVRIGAAAYGLLSSCDQFEQIPIATWKTSISFIRTIPADNYVGYDNTYKTTETTKVAVLPIGYYHGYHRNLSNAGIVLIKTAADNTNFYAPVIGRVCMNQIIINVTHIPNIAPGDQVILMGPYDKVRPADLAHYSKSYNPREITTTINETIKRVIITPNLQKNNFNQKERGAMNSKNHKKSIATTVIAGLLLSLVPCQQAHASFFGKLFGIAAVTTGACVLANWLATPTDYDLISNAQSAHQASDRHYKNISIAIESAHGIQIRQCSLEQKQRIIDYESETNLYNLGASFFGSTRQTINNYLSDLHDAINLIEQRDQALNKRMREIAKKDGFATPMYREMEQTSEQLIQALVQLKFLRTYFTTHESYFYLYEFEASLYNRYQRELEMRKIYEHDRFRLQDELRISVLMSGRSHEHHGYIYQQYVQKLDQAINTLNSRMNKLSFAYHDRIGWCRYLSSWLVMIRNVILTDPEYMRAVENYKIYLQREALIAAEQAHAYAEMERIKLEMERMRLEQEKLQRMRDVEVYEIIY